MLHSNPIPAGMKRRTADIDNIVLVVSLEIGKCIVKQMLVDTSSTANALVQDAIAQIGITELEGRPYILPLIGFIRRSINSSGIVSRTTWQARVLDR